MAEQVAKWMALTRLFTPESQALPLVRSPKCSPRFSPEFLISHQVTWGRPVSKCLCLLGISARWVKFSCSSVTISGRLAGRTPVRMGAFADFASGLAKHISEVYSEV